MVRARVPSASKRGPNGKTRYHLRIPPPPDEAQAYNASRSPASAQAAWERILLRGAQQKKLERASSFKRPEAEQPAASEAAADGCCKRRPPQPQR